MPLPTVTILGMDYDSLVGLANMFGFSLSKHDFVQAWHTTFHDSIEFSGAIFDVFDRDMDGALTILEVDDMLEVIKQEIGQYL